MTIKYLDKIGVAGNGAQFDRIAYDTETQEVSKNGVVLGKTYETDNGMWAADFGQGWIAFYGDSLPRAMELIDVVREYQRLLALHTSVKDSFFE
jgi:hypothetical protein